MEKDNNVTQKIKIAVCGTEKPFYNNISKSIPFIKGELKRYKNQLAALDSSNDYQNHEEARAMLKRFYQEKISELESRLALLELDVTDYEIISK